MTDKVEFDLEDLDDLKDLIGDERKRADYSFQKVFSLWCSTGSIFFSHSLSA